MAGYDRYDLLGLPLALTSRVARQIGTRRNAATLQQGQGKGSGLEKGVQNKCDPWGPKLGASATPIEETKPGCVGNMQSCSRCQLKTPFLQESSSKSLLSEHSRQPFGGHKRHRATPRKAQGHPTTL